MHVKYTVYEILSLHETLLFAGIYDAAVWPL